MHSIAVKIISLASLFVLTFVAGIVPLKLRHREGSDDRNCRVDLRRKQVISLCTCFAGGAFLASSMLELLPTVQREFKAVFNEVKIKTDFPVSEFGICVGFFLILILEQVIHVMKDKPVERPSEDSRPAHFEKDPKNASYADGECQQKLIGSSVIERDSGESDSETDHLCSNQYSNSHPPLNDYDPLHDEDDELQGTSNQSHDHNMILYQSTKHQNQRHYIRSYLLLTALSVHSLFEGLAVGLFQNIDQMVELLGVLIIHKCVLAFAIGINLVQHSFPPFMVIKSSILFATMSPIGLGLGILLLTYTSWYLGTIFSAIFQAIATGTFLYVTFFEIFFHELNSKECHRLLKVLMMILGFSLLTIVEFFDTEISKN